MSFPRYPAYKDSGVEWLGRVPSHWHVDRLKASIVSSRNGIWGDDSKGDENDIACVRVADFDRQKLRVELLDPTIRNVTAKERDGRTLNKGDLLLEKSGGGENQPVGCVVLYDDERPAVCSNFVARVQLAPGMVSSFWRYVHAAAYAVRLTTGSINQTSGIQNLDQDRYYNERAAFPTFVEQTAIATFLDHETTKIDALVAEQERLIELLKEKRQALISHAVAKGLDPSVPMKDSGVEWLGTIPSHWSVMPLAKIAMGPGSLFTDGDWVESKDLSDEGIRYVTTGNVGEGRYREQGYGYISQAKFDELRCTEVLPGDVLISRLNLPIGRACVVPDLGVRIITSVDNVITRPDSGYSRSYLAYMLSSASHYANMEILARGTTMQRISRSALGQVRFAFPPAEEQLSIATFLDYETDKIDALLAKANLVIRLLQERRSALISAAVTGQIDVRGVVTAKEGA